MSEVASSFSPRAKLTDPNSIVYQNVTRGMWDKLCQLTMEGVKLEPALQTCKIRPTVYRAIMRDDIASRDQLQNARHDWDNRNWPEDLIERICVGVATGVKLVDIANDELFEVETFHSLRMRDDYVDEMYMKARRILAEGMIDDLIEISDDDSNDMAMDAKGGDKPNTAAVQRARLKTDNRKWLAGKLLKDIYGEHQVIDAKVDLIVDHAARLEEARNRKEAGHRRVAKEKEVSGV